VNAPLAAEEALGKRRWQDQRGGSGMVTDLWRVELRDVAREREGEFGRYIARSSLKDPLCLLYPVVLDLCSTSPAPFFKQNKIMQRTTLRCRAQGWAENRASPHLTLKILR